MMVKITMFVNRFSEMSEEIIAEQKVEKDIGGEDDTELIFSDIKYICNSTGLITESLQKGFDVAQLPNGDIIVTEIRTVNVQYSWDKVKQKMVRVSHN